jgi:hypothetical protein
MLLLSLVLSGCAGLQGCGGGAAGVSNPEYAGAYAGTFHNSTDPDLAFSLQLAPSGTLSGTVTESGSARTSSVSGYSIDWYYACSSNQTLIEVTFGFPGESAVTLSGGRPLGQVQPWPFTAGYFNSANGSVTKKGSLLLSRS